MEAIKELQWLKYLLVFEEGMDRSAAMKKGRDNLLFQTNKNLVQKPTKQNFAAV